MKTFKLTKTDVIFAVLLIINTLILVGANLARNQIEKTRNKNTLVQPIGHYAHTANR